GARGRVDFLRDSQVRGSAPDVIGHVGPALPLGARLNGGIPRIAAHARRLVDRNPEVVAQLWSGHALRLVFPETRRPLTGEVNLRPRRCSARRDEQKHGGNGQTSNGAHTAPNAVPTAVHPRREPHVSIRGASASGRWSRSMPRSPAARTP